MRARDKQTASEIVGCGRFIVYDSTQENLGRGGGGGGGGSHPPPLYVRGLMWLFQIPSDILSLSY